MNKLQMNPPARGRGKPEKWLQEEGSGQESLGATWGGLPPEQAGLGRLEVQSELPDWELEMAAKPVRKGLRSQRIFGHRREVGRESGPSLFPQKAPPPRDDDFHSLVPTHLLSLPPLHELQVLHPRKKTRKPPNTSTFCTKPPPHLTSQHGRWCSAKSWLLGGSSGLLSNPPSF